MFGVVTQLLFFISHLSRRQGLNEAESFGILHVVLFGMKELCVGVFMVSDSI